AVSRPDSVTTTLGGAFGPGRGRGSRVRVGQRIHNDVQENARQIAGALLCGTWRNAAGMIGGTVSRQSAGGSTFFQQPEYRVWCKRQLHVSDAEMPQRVNNGICYRRWRSDGSRLAAAFDAKRIARSRRHMEVKFQRRHVARPRHGIIEK